MSISNSFFAASLFGSKGSLYTGGFTALFLMLVSLSTFSSCKEDHVHDDHYHADIDFIEPDEGQMFNSGDELHLEIEFSNDETIHNVSVEVLRESDDSVLFAYQEHVHAEDGLFDFHDHVMLTTTSHEHLQVVAKTWGHDADGDTIVGTRNIHLMP